MNALTGSLFFFSITGNYLLFWPVYRAFHAKKTQRCRALFNLFLLELCIYGIVTGALVAGTFWISDFHHVGFLLAEITYATLLIIFWISNYGVWADNSPYEVDS